MTVQGDFVHLHLHSQYSLLDGAIRFPQLFNKLSADGVNTVALTDHGNMFGVYDFYRQAKAHGIHPIVGCEVYVAPESRFKKKRDAKRDTSNHLILLAKNNEGYQNLTRLVSLAYMEGFYYKPRIDHELLEKYHAGLIALSACLKGEIPSLILNGAMDQVRERIQYYRTLFGDGNFYLEIQSNGIQEQDKVNDFLKQLSRDEGIPLVATNDCHYLEREDARAHEVLLCLQTGKTLLDKNRMKFQTEEFFLKSPREMYKQFQDVPDAIENTLEIAKRCNVDLDFKGYHFPTYELPDGKNHDSYLEEKATRGLMAHFERMRAVGKKLDEDLYRERLAYELETIKQMGFSDYFLIVSDFVGYAKEHQIPVGPGRGSAAGSLVSFALGITEIDPIPYNLMFERFLAPGRVSMPDIDCDFSEEKREQVIQYVAEKYGHDRVAQIITFSSMNAKAVVRDVGRVLGMPYGEVDKVAKAIPSVLKITLDEAIRLNPELKEMIESDAKIAQLMKIARTLEGLYRHSSTHAAGVVISSKPLMELLPVYVGPKDEILTQYDMSCVESVGLVKFDFLGLKTLSIIDRAGTLIREGRDPDFDIKSIPLDDKKTFALLRKGDVPGVFQLESSGMRDLLVRMKPKAFEDLIDLLALFRPGPLESGMVDDYIKRRNNKKLITYEIPELEEILGDTYGVILYQEQVMQISMKLAGFTPSDADRLRKAMGKKKAEEMAKLREKFVEGARQRGIDKKKAEKLYDQMAKFASYGFNKSHSTAYALIAYQTAYLKAHYPTEFMAAILSSEIGKSEKLAQYVDRCKGMGIEVLPPDVNRSDQDFKVEDGKIRFGLAGIKNVGEGAAEAIARERNEGGDFSSFLDFCTRLDLRKVNKRVLESLIKCGGFDSIEPSRARLMEALDEVLSVAQAIQKQSKSQQKSLFTMSSGDGSDHLMANFTYPDVEEWSQGKRLRFEKELLGIFLTGHPLGAFKEKIKAIGVTPVGELANVSSRVVVKVAGVVAHAKEITTKKNKERMAFVTLEDETGSVEVIVFPSIFKEAEFHLLPDEPVVVEGTVDKSGEVIKLKAMSVIPLNEVKEDRPMHIYIPASEVRSENLFGLRAFFEDKAFPGENPAIVHIWDEMLGEEAVLSLPYGLSKDEREMIEGKVVELFGEKARVEA